jgi:hypothetical protein
MMKLSVLPLDIAGAEGQEYTTPCKTMENVMIDYVESNTGNATEDGVGDFWFSIKFPLKRFKEIGQERYNIFNA